jgi:chorismate lyase / 3-hydroxybenzoate synthase
MMVRMAGDCMLSPVASVQPAIVPLSQLPGDALAVVAFGGAAPGALLSIDVPQLGAETVEVWYSSSPVRRHERDGVTLSANGEVLAGALACDDADPHRAAACVYDRLIGAARATGYPHLLRVWNHVRDINRVEHGLERYRAFCAGRHEAFAKHGYSMRGDLPAASAVGMRGGGVTSYFLASREPVVSVENPRQVSAYDYPPRYGPRSPSFSRATRGAGLVFVSGTSSVVGHETRHAGDVAAQLEETLVNLDSIVGAAGAREMLTAKVYLRDAADYPLIAARLHEAMPRTQTMFLHADLCREDLLVEIEAIAR